MTDERKRIERFLLNGFHICLIDGRVNNGYVDLPTLQEMVSQGEIFTRNVHGVIMCVGLFCPDNGLRLCALSATADGYPFRVPSVRKEEIMECEKCRWWHRLSRSAKEWDSADVTMGECHGAPPTARTESSRLNPDGLGCGYWTINYYQGYFPTTSVDDYCANFCQRDQG